MDEKGKSGITHRRRESGKRGHGRMASKINTYQQESKEDSATYLLPGPT